jgi:hypothetical protein
VDFQPALCCESYIESLAGRQIALGQVGCGRRLADLVVREPVPDGHQKLTRRGRLMTLHAEDVQSARCARRVTTELLRFRLVPARSDLSRQDSEGRELSPQSCPWSNRSSASSSSISKPPSQIGLTIPPNVLARATSGDVACRLSQVELNSPTTRSCET